ncbi:ABC transporter permease, partial [Kibdelosporangium lantanae]
SGLPVDGRLASLFGVLVLLVIIGYITSPDNFVTGSNLDTVLRQAAPSGVVAVGMTFVIISAGIDLSVGSVIGLASVWLTTLATQSYGPFVMVVCGLAVGLVAGLVNGVLIAYGRMVPFIATLAMYISAKGLAEFLSNKQTQVVRDQDFLDFFRGSFLGIPTLVWILIVVVVVGWVVLNRTTFGRRTFAVGGNPEATRLA